MTIEDGKLPTDKMIEKARQFREETNMPTLIPNPQNPEGKAEIIDPNRLTFPKKKMARLTPDNVERLGIKLGASPVFYEVEDTLTGKAHMVYATQEAAFLLDKDHPFVKEFQEKTAQVIIQKAIAGQPIFAAQGINDALMESGLPVVKFKDPMEALIFGAKAMEAYGQFLEKQEHVVDVQLRLSAKAAAGDALLVLREDIGKNAAQLLFTSGVRKQQATLMLRLAFATAAENLITDKTEKTIASVTAINKGLTDLKREAAQDLAERIAQSTVMSLGQLGQGAGDLTKNLVTGLTDSFTKISGDTLKLLLNATLGQSTYNEGAIKAIFDKAGIGGEKAIELAKKLGISVGQLFRGFYDALTTKKPEND